MRLVFTESAWEDYLWFQIHDRRLLKRINALNKETLPTRSQKQSTEQTPTANTKGLPRWAPRDAEWQSVQR
ncbi:MAG: type II toxin-antitoxin system YoeB family toxin [Planctomycetes bacterium]|nr:type II toxin-antitoxin system YoeB family toxin [Planctomycetota bacterium]